MAGKNGDQNVYISLSRNDARKMKAFFPYNEGKVMRFSHTSTVDRVMVWLDNGIVITYTVPVGEMDL